MLRETRCLLGVSTSVALKDFSIVKNAVQIQFQLERVLVYILGEKSLNEWQRFVRRANFQFASNVQLFKLADVLL